MKFAGATDLLTVINGPEDGTQFAITQREFLIGKDPRCSVNLRLDADVSSVHARGSAVSDGYRIRSAGSAPVLVNGKRATRVRSQIARPGDVLNIGRTELVLECAADGLARRSRGIAIESDAGWALRHAAQLSMHAAQVVFQLGRGGTQNSLWKNKLLWAVGLGTLYLVVPQFRYGVHTAWWYLREAFYIALN